MAFKAKGPRARTRHKLQKKIRGMPKVNDMLKKFTVGDNVAIVIDSAVHSAMPYARFQGKIGSVVGTRGSAYLVKIKDGGKMKTLISHPVHLKKVM
jgi:large subunit ribosomal protein L21e